MKICYHCKKIKTKSEFTPDKRTKDKLKGICKTCHAEKSRAYYEANKE